MYKLCCVSFSYQHTLMAIYNDCILHFGELLANLYEFVRSPQRWLDSVVDLYAYSFC